MFGWVKKLTWLYLKNNGDLDLNEMTFVVIAVLA